MLCNRIDFQGYKGCQDDIQTVSGMVEHTHDAVVDYQVGGDGAWAVDVQLRLGYLDRWPSDERSTTRIAD